MPNTTFLYAAKIDPGSFGAAHAFSGVVGSMIKVDLRPPRMSANQSSTAEASPPKHEKEGSTGGSARLGGALAVQGRCGRVRDGIDSTPRPDPARLRPSRRKSSGNMMRLSSGASKDQPRPVRLLLCTPEVCGAGHDTWQCLHGLGMIRATNNSRPSSFARRSFKQARQTNQCSKPGAATTSTSARRSAPYMEKSF